MQKQNLRQKKNSTRNHTDSIPEANRIQGVTTKTFQEWSALEKHTKSI